MLSLAALLLTFAVSWPARELLLRFGVVDWPNARSSHSHPTVRGGGVAILLSVVVVGAVGLPLSASSCVLGTMLLLAVVLGIVAFIDDLRCLPAAFRFACHAVSAAGLLVALHLTQPNEGMARFLFVAALAFMWVTGYTNAFNFMDGINGLATAQALIGGVGTALLGGLSLGEFSSPPVLFSLVIAGAALGFLPLNFPKARMFMGDVGSVPLGFLLSGVVLWVAKIAGWWLLVPLTLVHANFVLDTGITLFRRIARGERWYEPHREHFYQRLVRAGRSHTFATGCEMALQAIVLALMVLYLYVSPPLRAVLVATVLVLWLGFFTYCERSFRKGSLRDHPARVPCPESVGN